MKRLLALVLAMVMVLSLASTAFAAMGGNTFADAKANSDWDFTVTLENAEDELDSQFATYSIEATAKKDGAAAFWATLTNVEKNDNFDVEIDGEGHFIKVADESYADLVIIDGKVVTYFAKASTYNEKGWAGKAEKVNLPALPDDAADCRCNTLYNISNIPGVFYFFDNTLYVSDADGDTILNTNGICVVAREAVMDVDYFSNPHMVEVAYSGDMATKVYCDNCKITFAFVQGSEANAIKAFGAGNYHNVENDVWMSTRANTGGGTAGAVAGIIDLPSFEWDVVATTKREGDSQKQTFETYTLEATARIDGADAYWTTVDDVKKGDVFEITFDGETEFVEVAVEEQAHVVAKVTTDDGRYTKYYAVAKDYEAGYVTVANSAWLYPLPADTDDCECYRQYSSIVDEFTELYKWHDDMLQDVWYMPDVDGTVIICGGGKAVKANVIDTPDITYFEHSYAAELDNGNVTKVYCPRCEENFDFIIGDEADAILAFGVHTVYENIAAETGVDCLWILQSNVERAYTGDPIAIIRSQNRIYDDVSIAISDKAKSGDTVALGRNAALTAGATVPVGVALVISADYTLTTEADLGAEKGARIACGGTLVVSADTTVDLYNLTRSAVVKDFIGDVTIKDGGLLILPSDWGNADWDLNEDTALLAILKDCEVGAKIKCDGTTWKKYDSGAWLPMAQTGGGADNTVEVDTTIEDTAATVDGITNMDEITNEEGKTDNITIDLSDANGNNNSAPIDTVNFIDAVIKQIVEAVKKSVEIILGGGVSIELDADALDTADKTEGAELTISIKPTTDETVELTEAQKKAVKGEKAFDVKATKGDKNIFDKDNKDKKGTITLSAPHELEKGQKPENVVVYYVDDYGRKHKCDTRYDSVQKRVTWETNHLSVYMIDYEEPVYHWGGGYTATEEPEIKSASTFDAGIGLYVGMSMLAATGSAVVIGKKKAD